MLLHQIHTCNSNADGSFPRCFQRTFHRNWQSDIIRKNENKIQWKAQKRTVSASFVERTVSSLFAAFGGLIWILESGFWSVYYVEDPWNSLHGTLANFVLGGFRTWEIQWKAQKRTGSKNQYQTLKDRLLRLANRASAPYACSWKSKVCSALVETNWLQNSKKLLELAACDSLCNFLLWTGWSLHAWICWVPQHLLYLIVLEMIAEPFFPPTLSSLRKRAVQISPNVEQQHSVGFHEVVFADSMWIFCWVNIFSFHAIRLESIGHV